MNDNFRWTGNMERGQDGTNVYWRTLNRLETHPLSMMLSKDARDGLAVMVFEATTRDGKYVSNPTAVKVVTKELIENSPLSFMSDKACATLADVVVSGLYPKTRNNHA